MDITMDTTMDSGKKSPLPAPDDRAISDFVPLDRVTSVFLVVTNSVGGVMGVWGGLSGLIIPLLQHYADKVYKAPGPAMVAKQTDTLTALGQDIYQVERAFVLNTRLAMDFMPMEDLATLEKRLPSGANYSFVVSY